MSELDPNPAPPVDNKFVADGCEQFGTDKPDDVTTLPSQFQIGALVQAQGQRTEVTAVLFTQSSVFYQVVGSTGWIPSSEVEPCVEADAPKPTIF